MSKVRIQDDLYTYVNQEKLEELVIPDDQPCVGGFQTLAVELEKLMINEFNEMEKNNSYPNVYLKNAITLYKKAKDFEKKEKDDLKSKDIKIIEEFYCYFFHTLNNFIIFVP